MEDKRKAERKMVKVKTLVKLTGGEAIMGRSFDLADNGVGILLDVPLKTGIEARVSIGLLVNGVVDPIHTHARVQYCIFSSGEYRIGFQFTQIDAVTATTLARFLR
ncbi:PilZ domain-containing protein [Massilia sp. S19_KUP03_FR1]|uniref:PilZ domain-containing protein n=1 Tax=Massilia sp. S19_KUP03_FR1 TaxID=3025503 RepID=UPI002FCDC71A